MLIEKIFQRDDKFFLLVYHLFLALILFVSSNISYFLRNKSWQLPDKYLEATIIISLIFLVLSLFKSKESRFIRGIVQWFRIELMLVAQTFIIAILISVMLKISDDYSRIWLFTNIAISFFLFLLIKVIFDFFYTVLIKTNLIQRNILLIGDSKACQKIIHNFPKKVSNSVIKCLIVIDTINKNDLNYYGVPTFSLNDDYEYILNHHFIGQIWIISSTKTQSYIEGMVDKFINYPVDCRLILPESKFKFIEGLDSEAGYDFYNVSFSPFYGTNFLIKNLMDKFFSLIFLLISAPIIIIFSIFILVEDGFPIFFIQKRTGWDGRSFNIFKLRSLSKSGSSKFKQVIGNDKRILKIGRIIRRLSIDELPQFYNVLKGDMSIVGPRPHPEDLTKYSTKEIRNFMQRHKCLPGITGWAQVHGLRGPTAESGSMNKRVQHDLYYIKNWNLMLDLYILIKTIFVVLFQKVD